jgi:predicted O-methyltransferase YrrM
MLFKHVHNKVKEVPFISKENAKSLYDFIIKNRPINILELGFAHGTASCYIAAALDEIGEGRLVCVDLLEVEAHFKPSIESQLNALGLADYVDIHRMQSGYNWFLHNEIKTCTQAETNYCTPKYDLIIIDGPKNWIIDSSSFYLSDKLLKEDGWIIWDDYNWTYAQADTRREATDGISHRVLSKEELMIPHIKEIFHLLVMQHPDYGNFIIQENSDWAWANKKKQAIKKVKYTHSQSFKIIVIKGLKSMINKIRMIRKS